MRPGTILTQSRGESSINTVCIFFLPISWACHTIRLLSNLEPLPTSQPQLHILDTTPTSDLQILLHLEFRRM
jgi:hypothetical protein